MVTLLTTLLLVAVVAAIVVLSRRGRRSRPGGRPATTGVGSATPGPRSDPAGRGSDPAGPVSPGGDDLPRDSWHARVSAADSISSALAAQFGQLALEEGVLDFRLDDLPAPVWTVAATEVTATQRSFFAASDLTLSSAATGDLRVTVSRERINRFVRNDFKDRRQRVYAEDFLAALMLSGATVR